MKKKREAKKIKIVGVADIYTDVMRRMRRNTQLFAPFPLVYGGQIKCHHTTQIEHQQQQQQQYTQTPELLLYEHKKHASHRIHAIPHTRTYTQSPLFTF